MSALVWFLTTLVLAGAELAVGEFFLLMVAGGAAAGGVAALLGGTWWVQLAVFALVSLALIGVVRPVVRRHLNRFPKLTTGAEALEGSVGFVVDTVEGRAGRVSLDGDVWSARPKDETDTIPAGSRVRVIRIDGATAVVDKEL